jgi:conjugal transfer pilus assembly protein TraA
MHVEHTANERTLPSPLEAELHMQSLTLPRRHSANGFGKAVNLVIPVAIAAFAASAAYAGADTTFTPALTKFTDFLEGSGGKIITVLSLAGGLIGLASGRFSLSQVAVPVGVGIGVGTGVPIVTSVVTAVI